MLELICKELGVEIGEIWEGNDGYRYKITEDGDIEFYYIASNDEEECEIDSELWVSIMNGDLKPAWKPKEGEVYYVPYPIISDRYSRYVENKWVSTYSDEWAFTNNLVYKTKEEAIEAANKMMKALKE